MKAALHNLGCKTNSYEAEAMEQDLRDAGYEIIEFSGEVPADIYIINTCSVTNIADRKSRQMLHKARLLNPAAIVVAVGCFVQTSKPEILEKEGIDICLGSNDKGKLLESISAFIREGKGLRIISDLKGNTDYEALSVAEKPKHTRAFIKIEDGCNQFCTFCIIPYARGRVRSRKVGEIVEEVKRLANKGIKEIVLTGINMSAYGTDLDCGADLADLLIELNNVGGVERIRISSLEPGLVSVDFLEKIKSVTKLCPHFHLSLQSGSDSVLKRMNRRYSCKEYLTKCELLRKYYDDPSITTDIITGFPGETEEEFSETMNFVEAVNFFDMHVFAFSPREGTPAAGMTDKVDGRIKRIRSALLIKKASELKYKHMESFLGETQEVLIEEIRRLKLFGNEEASDREYFTGHTRKYLKVIIPIERSLREGDLVSVRLENIVYTADGEAVITAY